MTALDIFVLLLMGGAGLLGFKRGFVTESLSLGAWVLAIAAVKVLHGPVSSRLAGMVGTESGGSALAFALIFGLAMFVGRMIARKIGAETKNSFIGSFDRVLGLGFGVVKGLILATVVFLFFALIFDLIRGSENRPEWMTQSRTYPLLRASGDALIGFVNEHRSKAD